MAFSIKKRRLVGVTSLTLAGLAVSAWHHANGEAVTAKQPAVEAEASLVRALKVEPKEIDDVRVAIGEIKPQRESDPDVYKLLLERQIDAVTFTSASSVRHFVKTLGEEQAPDLLTGTVVASIGPVTAEAAQQLGITSTIVPTEYTVTGLVQALVEHFRRG